MPRLTVIGNDAAQAQGQPQEQVAAAGRAISGSGVGPRSAERFLLQVGPSAIDGLGVFAQEAIPARRKIGEMRGEIISVAEARRRAKGQARVHLVEISARTAVDASQTTGALRYINHSCAPNTSLQTRQGRAEFFALRDIVAGEELTANYGISHHDGRLRCHCGAPQCRGRL
ncbi:MAG: SET domain-containing protein-lysine N-methyltransferase [Burkholderiaceae bacterium]|nr:SET domain-containing protein-lysine N-methyltransferase [Burkholderiaceae bacterium]